MSDSTLIDMTLDTDASLPEIPEISYLLPLDKSYQMMRWYGNGRKKAIGIARRRFHRHLGGHGRSPFCRICPAAGMRNITEARCAFRGCAIWAQIDLISRPGSIRGQCAPYAPLELGREPPLSIACAPRRLPARRPAPNGACRRRCLERHCTRTYMLRAGKPYRFQLFLTVENIESSFQSSPSIK